MMTIMKWFKKEEKEDLTTEKKQIVVFKKNIIHYMCMIIYQ